MAEDDQQEIPSIYPPSDDNKGLSSWEYFRNEFIDKGFPVKIESFVKFRQNSHDENSFSNKNSTRMWGMGAADGESIQDIIARMPNNVMDRMVNVQVVAIPSDEARLDGCVKQSTKRRRTEVRSKEFRTVQEIDAYLASDSSCNKSEKNVPVFMGQEDQVCMEAKFGKVLQGNAFDDICSCDEGKVDSSYVYCIAQEPILSMDDESNTDSEKCCKYEIESKEDGSISYELKCCCETNECSVSEPNSSLEPLSKGLICPSMLLPAREVSIHNVNLWYKPEIPNKSVSNWHHDGDSNILMVINGKKQIELCPPDSIQASAIFTEHANHPAVLRRNALKINRENLQKLVTKSKSLIIKNRKMVTITAGNAIFIPPGWWHRVESLGSCLAVNVWFNSRSSVHFLATSSNTHMLAFQARELVRLYFDKNYIEESMKYIQNSRDTFTAEILEQTASIDVIRKLLIRSSKFSSNILQDAKHIAKFFDALLNRIDVRKGSDQEQVVTILEKCLTDFSSSPELVRQVIQSLSLSSNWIIVQVWSSGGSKTCALPQEVIDKCIKTVADSCRHNTGNVFEFMKQRHEEFKEMISRRLIIDHLIFGRLT